MTKVALLQAFKAYTEEVVKDVILPVSVQKRDETAGEMRAAEVHIGRLPDTTSQTKKAPYILHQIVNSKTAQEEGQLPESVCLVRSVFCVYNEDAEAGTLSLIELMDRLDINSSRDFFLADTYELDREAGTEQLVYPDNTAPYYFGEMLTVWKMPTVKREVRHLWE